MPPKNIRSKIHLTPPETVRRILHDQLPFWEKKAPPGKIKHPTEEQWTLLRKLERAKSAPVPSANRGVYKKRRGRAVQTAMGQDVRRLYVMEALDEIHDAKRAELSFIRDTRRATYNVARPRYSPAAPRRRKTCSARDVMVWLAHKKVGKFCISTIWDDLRSIRQATTYRV